MSNFSHQIAGFRITRLAIFAAMLLGTAIWPTTQARAGDPGIRIGSKKFTESVILGEMLALLARDAGAEVVHRRELGGTRVLWNALRGGEIDAYPEYTGTIAREILAGRSLSTPDEIAAALAEFGVRMSRPLGFNNTYAIGMKEEVASARKVRTLSDLRRHPDLRLGFSSEFLNRGDGWPELRKVYSLPQKSVVGLDHDLAYRGLLGDTLDVTDFYSTDAEIAQYGLRVLEDDLGHFPAYHAVILHRGDLSGRENAAVLSMLRLAGSIDQVAMARLNARVKIEQTPEIVVAADFLTAHMGLTIEPATISVPTRGERLLDRTIEHLLLVGLSLAAAILVSIPLGVFAAKWRRSGQLVLGVTGILQTVPSMALLVFMIPLLGIGAPPAIAALFLYSLLPIVRNTHAGLQGISRELSESAWALGLTPSTRLWRIELPLASRSILAGIKTSAVINVGTATLGAIIGAGGYGQPILTGIRLDNMPLILEGAIPAAAMAVAVHGILELVERRCIPRGLRLRR